MSTALQPLPVCIEPGTLIAGKYRVERTIAAGGMGVVLGARHDTLGNPVAIKVMLPDAVAQEGAQDRFLREARAAAHLTSEHVVRVFDVGTLDSGLPFMVMEHLSGKDLAAILAERGPLPFADAAAYVLQVVEGLIEAHQQGVVHRDLKPSNLFVLARGGRLKILDFGISKIVSPNGPISSADAVRTSTQALMGSPMYMSPEQVRSTKNVDRSTDIWSLGVIFTELLTAKMPFEAESIGAVFARILTEPIPLVTKARPDVPKALAAVIARCLDRDPEKRPTAAQLKKLLAPFASAASRVPVPSRSAAASSPSGEILDAADAATLSLPDASGARHLAPRSSRTPIGIAIGGALVAVIAVLGYLFIHRSGALTTADPSLVGAAQDPKNGAGAPPVVTVSLGPTAPLPVTASPSASDSAAPPASSSGNTVYPSSTATGTRTKTSTAGKPPKGINLNSRD